MTWKRNLYIAVGLALSAITTSPQPAHGQTASTMPGATPEFQDSDPNKLADQALILLENNEGEAAFALFQKAKQLNPNLSKLNLLAARLSAADNKYDQAQLYYTEYVKSPDGKSDYRPFAELGRIYLRSKSYRLARRNLEQARQLAPERDSKDRFVRAEIMADLANVLRVLRDDKEAIRVGREAATQATSDPKIQIMFSQLLLSISPNETKESRDVAARAIALLNTDLEVNTFSEPKLRLLRDALAIVEATWAQETLSQKDNPLPVYMLSIATQDTAEVTMRISLLSAKEYADRAATLNEGKPEYRVRQAEIEAMLGSTRTALEKLEKVLEVDPENAAALALKDRIASMPKRELGAAAKQ